MKTSTMTIALAVSALFAASTFAQEKATTLDKPTAQAPTQQTPTVQKPTQETPTPQESIKELAELGPGVHKVKKDENNVFKSCVVVGQARISTVLGFSKGLATARRNAKLKAESEFVSWLKTHTSSVRSSGDEVEFKLKGDGNGSSESGVSTETSVETITSSAQGAIRGLTLIGSSQDPESAMLTQVYAWKPDYARIADQVEAAMPVQKPTAADAAKKASTEPAKAPASPIKAKTVVSPEAKEFL